MTLDILLSSANKVEELLSLEAQYGPLSGYTPAINTIHNYLQQVSASYSILVKL